MPTELATILALIGIVALFWLACHLDGKAARQCGVCRGEKEPSARFCADCEREVPAWLV